MTSRRSLARAGLIVTSAFFAARILGWVRLLVISTTFGASPELDAFFAAFRIPDLIFQLVAAGALGTALIPVLAGLFARDENDHAWRVTSTIGNLMIIALGVLAGVVFVQGKRPSAEVVREALNRNIPLVATKMSMFEACARMAGLVEDGGHGRD